MGSQWDNFYPSNTTTSDTKIFRNLPKKKRMTGNIGNNQMAFNNNNLSSQSFTGEQTSVILQQQPDLQHPQTERINPDYHHHHGMNELNGGTFIMHPQIVPTSCISSQAPGFSQKHYVISAPNRHQQLKSIYESEETIIEKIVRHFGTLSDDEKTVTKINIQRILMDARFGRGACLRMFREEELSELANSEAIDASHRQNQQLTAINPSR